jgi:hypothetical protein
MLLKSYGPDLEYARRLVRSFHEHNADDITLFCVVPPEDLGAFSSLASSSVTVLSESELGHHLVSEDLNGYRRGYVNQEIVKLSFWELGRADDYFCVDSEAVFIRDFTRADFVAPDGHPYTVLVEDNELKVEPRYYREHWVTREQMIRRIADEIGFDDPVLRTCHGHQVFSTVVLRSLVEDFLAPRGWDYKDALAVSPFEFSWYNLWLQKTQVIPIHQREPLVKVFHNESQHLEYLMRGIRVEDIARGYLAVLVNSNFSRDIGIIDPHASKSESIAPYLSYGELGRVLTAKARETGRRRLRFLRERS